MISATYTVHPTPVGDALLVFTDEGLVALHVTHDDGDDALAALSLALRALPGRDDAVDGDLRRQLDEYFEGSRRTFEVTLDWRLTHGFTREALEAVREIPYARVASYGEVAAMAGRARAARAVGTACATTPWSIVVPVHRVVRSDGSMGEYGGHPEVKRFLLDLEAAAGE
ncbi:MAG: methylated-DNA--[protein]-cysteine S-methyltransferase [Microbacterium sp.]|uniref:methylated-DNA--[protein]-cysteine S-methyltransferase n=1 Tax=Microbacterium sp. TaxID=51671 RepID=UPI001AD36EAE|nr:methylated-DNA--[protein]-cysteine S-methyltransferase [Microbacterium sp.]MBN9155341.1 methylated-DNA--[protein]-cysteine S-methyltransferase [Microbacterium sp.]